MIGFQSIFLSIHPTRVCCTGFFGITKVFTGVVKIDQIALGLKVVLRLFLYPDSTIAKAVDLSIKSSPCGFGAFSPQFSDLINFLESRFVKAIHTSLSLTGTKASFLIVYLPVFAFVRLFALR